MRRRAAAILAAPAVVALLVPATTLAKDASDGGEGLAGETTDKYVTFFSLGVLVFFFLVIVVFSAIQGRLQRRKEEQKASHVHRAGW